MCVAYVALADSTAAAPNAVNAIFGAACFAALIGVAQTLQQIVRLLGPGFISNLPEVVDKRLKLFSVFEVLLVIRIIVIGQEHPAVLDPGCMSAVTAFGIMKNVSHAKKLVRRSGPDYWV